MDSVDAFGWALKIAANCADVCDTAMAQVADVDATPKTHACARAASHAQACTHSRNCFSCVNVKLSQAGAATS
eukprot:1359222-Pleurochrysis_carterae.AAC.3